MQRYDAIIIGFGKAGKTLAADLASVGQKVAIIEKSAKMYGGTCINVGCIPTKSLVKSSKQAELLHPLNFAEKAEIYSNAIAEKTVLTTMLRQKNFDKLNNQENITIYTGIGRFTSANSVEVQTATATQQLTSDKIFINTGSTPVIPPISGIKNNPHVFFSETLLDLAELPKRLTIIGGGYIGLEFASFFSSFGSQVTVLQDGATFIPREDADIAMAIKKVLEDKRIKFITGAKITSIENSANTARVLYTKPDGQHELVAEAILVATGRRPNTAELNLAAAGIETTERGAVKTDENLRTNVAGIWGMGDVVGGLQFTYISLDDYRIVKAQLPELQFAKQFNHHTTKTRANIPYSVFLDPPFSRIGLNEKEALEQGYSVKIAKMPVAAIPKAQILKETNGVLKAIIDEKTDKILGMMLFCAESHEIINIVKVVMDANLPYTYLKDQIFTHPTMSESLNDLLSQL